MTGGYLEFDRPADLVPPGDVTLSKAIVVRLEQAYPGHPWGATVDRRNGIAVVRNFGLSGKWGFMLKTADLDADPNLRSVVTAGGELLERFRISRSAKARGDDYRIHPLLRHPDL